MEEMKSTRKTIIQSKCHVFGEVVSNDDLFVYGEIKGNIQCENDVVVGGVVVGDVDAHILNVYGASENNGKEGSVYGKVSTNEVVSNGKIKGDCFVKENILLGSDATVIGDINAGSVEIKKGASLRGAFNINR